MTERTGPGFRLLIIFLVGMAIRLPIVAVAPVLPLIHRDLGLDETSIAALNGLPVLLFALAAIPGSLLISRIGARRALIAGLIVVSIASALRGLGMSTPTLFAMTFVMGVAVAIIQPAAPAVVTQWFPAATSRATALFGNGMVIGATISGSLTIPLVLPLVGGSWGWSFAIWAVPVFAIALLVAGCTPAVVARTGQPRALWWPNWRDSRTWRLGLLQGGGSVVFYSGLTFFPDYLHAIGRPELVSPVLASYNACQFPASLLITVFASRMSGKRSPFIFAGATALLGLGAMFASQDWIIITAAAVVGIATVYVLILTLALVPLVADPGDAHRLSAGMLAIGYFMTYVIPLIGGRIWDWTDEPATAFLPGMLGSVIIIVMALTLRPGDSRSRKTSQ